MKDKWYRSSHFRWSVAIGMALCLHLLPVLWFLWPERHTAADNAPAAALMVELAAVAAAPDVLHTELPPAPELHEQSEPAEAVPETQATPLENTEDIPPLPELAEPEVVLPEKTEPQPEPEKPVEPEEKPTKEAQTASAASAPSSPAPSENLADKNMAQTDAVPVNPMTLPGVISWRDKLLGQLNKAKRYPSHARMRRQEGVSYLRFSMDRQGRVLAASLEQSSGHNALDTETLELIRRAEPLEIPPDDIPGEVIELVVPVEFFLKNQR